ncbi:hypothetical protein TWF506_011087 [Arthrobotrys conoides]|uniref:Uncharacterized protein n=1 Tax=Arthrobotrys conoides TaxID=74498 RepID=A0AAN8NA02_9PEZI
MGVFKKDNVNTWSECSVNIFDCTEDPLAALLPVENGQPHSGHKELRHFCSDALKRVDGVISELNNDESKPLRRLGYSWIIKSVHIDWNNLPEKEFVVVFELRNSRVAFDRVFGSHVANEVTLDGVTLDEWSEVSNSETIASG